MKALVLPALGFPPTNTAYAFLAGNSRALPGMLLTVIVGAGIGEEILCRGFPFERIGTWLQASRGSKLLVLVLSSILFGLAHLGDQGIPGAVQAVMTGLRFGALYLLSGDLALPMVTHAAFDVTAVILIYKGWSPRPTRSRDPTCETQRSRVHFARSRARPREKTSGLAPL